MNTLNEISIASKNDLTVWNEILRIDQQFFPYPWTDKGWNEMDFSMNYLFKATHKEKVIGFCLVQFLQGDESAHLQKICLIPPFRGSGFAETFLDFVREFFKAKACKVLFLEVESSNLRAIKFYLKCGFSPQRMIKNYYSGGGDAQTMTLAL